jgi:CheY-like chemotaxis protein/CHASE3 domain sensor protein
MPHNPYRRAGSRANVDLWTTLGLVLVLTFFLISGSIAFRNIQVLRTNNQMILHSHQVLIALDDLLSTAQDAETGQRGYLLTGNDRYLEPYQSAVTAAASRIEAARSLTTDNPVQQANIRQLERHIDAKLAELDETIKLRRVNAQAAMAVVATDRGKTEMDAIRSQLDVMRREEDRLRDLRLAEMDQAYRTATASGVLSGLLGAILTIAVFVLVRRAASARAREDWLQSGQVGLSEAMMGDKSVEGLSEAILAFLSDYLGFQAGALFKGENGSFYRAAALGLPADAHSPLRFDLKEGLLGKVAAEGRSTIVRDVPDGYMTIGSALGHDKPRHLVLVPTHADETVNAVLELGFLHPVDERVLHLLDQAAASIGIALRSARYRAELQNALEETQRQSEELQVQSEELRVSNEELEEQSRALKESQVRLEQQQVELEQTNSQLEEQAQTLEHQKDALERTSEEITLKARELERASQYKSDFLANMSHELRTPLNSMLILSGLLKDNPDGNLTEKQVGFAQTIVSSGNDLLVLINDILDLSKIEAGHVEVLAEPLSLQRLSSDLSGLFHPMAEDRGLGFEIDLSPQTPHTIHTDRQRLEQILKNLLSNAFKFTQTGGVRLAIAPNLAGGLSFRVEDTGIGVPPEHQESIFEAFRQADGTISRRYGGTGLGLSISRELARLLGGAITLESRPGEGSIFTLSIPLAYDPSQVSPRQALVAAQNPAPDLSSSTPMQKANLPAASVEDDRDRLSSARRVLLVIEDDAAFAAIVRDLSREIGFQALVAGTADEALTLARQFKPSAVVLDVGLPDESGLMVLDRLKRDDATRHIPIHVVSANDHAQTALSLGAIGYMVKPVRREDLTEVLHGLQAKLSSAVKRVLVVEDDVTQREAVRHLLSAGDVETVGVGTAAECLEALRAQTFDCMVLDLSLPDASGYSLLETLSQDSERAFPPVIVYTGHDLSADDEQRLRRYSSSIIIKGAKSPERLLDEVSLFLHQVVSELPPEQQKMIQKARNRDAMLEGRRILIVEDDIRNVYSLTNLLEPRGAIIQIARNGQEAIEALDRASQDSSAAVDLVLMDVMMPVMDGLSATRQIRQDPRWRKLPILMLTAKAMPDDQERCIAAGGSDYMAKPIDVDKLLSLVRVWMPR